MRNRSTSRFVGTAFAAALAVLMLAAPTTAFRVSGAVEGQLRWAGLSNSNGQSDEKFQSATRLDLRGVETWRTGIPGNLTVSLGTTPEPPIYRDQTQDRFRRADLRTLAFSANLLPLPRLTVGTDYALRLMDEEPGTLAPFTETAYGASFNYAPAYRPVWYGELRGSRVVDTAGGWTRNNETTSGRAGVSFNSASLVYSLETEEHRYDDYTGVAPREESQSVTAAWRWNPTTASNLNASYRRFLQDAGGVLSDVKTIGLSGSVVVWPRLQLRSSYLGSDATVPVDRAVLSQLGVGVDLDTPWRFRISADHRSEERWSDYYWQPEPFTVWELHAQTALGQGTATLSQRWDFSEPVSAFSERAETTGLDLEWPVGRYGSAKIGFAKVDSTSAIFYADQGLYMYPEVAVRRDVAKGLSFGVNARGKMALDGGANTEAGATLYARGRLAAGYLVDLSYSGQGTTSESGTWSASTGFFGAIQHVSGLRSTQTASYRRTNVSADWTLDSTDDEQTGLTEEFQLGFGTPLSKSATWLFDWRWNRTSNSGDLQAMRRWWTVSTGIRWEF